MTSIVLTGASYGIGREVALSLASYRGNALGKNVKVLLVARTQDKLIEVRDNMKKLCGEFIDDIFIVSSDLSTDEGLSAVVSAAKDDLGSIDYFISCAALSPFVLFDELPEQELRQLLAVNLTAPMVLARKWLPDMIKRRTGKVIVLSSMAGKYGLPFNAAYSASKAGLVQWVQALRNELDGTGVDVRVICPMSVSGVGVSARGGQKTPWLLGEVSPERVCKVILRALEGRGSFETIVSARPVRPLLMLGQLWPDVGVKIVGWLGITRMYAAIGNPNRKRVPARAGQ
jgi:short-subunit dehydrogenase